MANAKPNPNPLEEIAKLQAQIEELKGGALQELKDRRVALEQELKAVDAEIEKLTGKPAAAKRTRRTNAPDMPARTPDLQELKEMLSAAPDKTIGIRKEGLDLRNIKILAEANPHLLKLGGKGPWPTVTLLR
jgi:predicted  nucleic acid-binding Zn-ribbon protein